MNKLKNKNKSISKTNKFNNDDTVITQKGYKCIGPCYPANTLYYNPLGLIGVISSYPSCPIKKVMDKEYNNYIYADKCDAKDITPDYQNYDIFDDSVKIASTHNLFLSQIYNINDLQDVVKFLNDTIDSLPIYSQKRLLNSIFINYYKFNEFPLKLFIDKSINIFKSIYLIKIDYDKIYKNILKLNNKDLYNDIFSYLIDKIKSK